METKPPTSISLPEGNGSKGAVVANLDVPLEERAPYFSRGPRKLARSTDWVSLKISYPLQQFTICPK